MIPPFLITCQHPYNVDVIEITSRQGNCYFQNLIMMLQCFQWNLSTKSHCQNNVTTFYMRHLTQSFVCETYKFNGRFINSLYRDSWKNEFYYFSFYMALWFVCMVLYLSFWYEFIPYTYPLHPFVLKTLLGFLIWLHNLYALILFIWVCGVRLPNLFVTL